MYDARKGESLHYNSSPTLPEGGRRRKSSTSILHITSSLDQWIWSYLFCIEKRRGRSEQVNDQVQNTGSQKENVDRNQTETVTYTQSKVFESGDGERFNTLQYDAPRETTITTNYLMTEGDTQKVRS